MALRYILDGTEVFDSTVIAVTVLRDHVYVLNRTIRHQKPVFIIKILDVSTSRTLRNFRYECFVFRMVARRDQFKRYRSSGFKFVNAIKLPRPIEDASRKIPGKSASQTGALAFGKKRLAAP